MESMTNDILTKSVTTSSKSKRVLWFTTSPSLSRSKLDGSYNVGTSWIEAMEELIHKETDIELAIAFIWKCTEVERYTIEGSPTHYFKMPRRPKGKAQNMVRKILCLAEPQSGITDYLEVVHQFKPDVINFFGTESPYPLIIPHIDIPHVIWFQGNLTVYHLKWYAGISIWHSLTAESMKNLLLGDSDIHSYLTNRQFVRREKSIFKTALNFIGRTSWDRRLVSTMAPQATYFHCDEIMRSTFYEHIWSHHRSREKLVIVSTFRDNLFKGLETAMSAYKILSTLLNKPLVWNIIGVPPNSHYERVSRKVSKLRTNPGLKMLGVMPAGKMIQCLLDADLFVHPSHIDNSPNSVCEAMLLGMPIVSTNVGGIPSILEDGVEGDLVQNGDEYAMAGAILRLLEDHARAKLMAQRARQKALHRNNPKRILNDLLKVYEDIQTSKKSA